MKKRELRELIEQGEGYFAEFKEQIGKSLDKEMVAFANASGGKIVIGVAGFINLLSAMNKMELLANCVEIVDDRQERS